MDQLGVLIALDWSGDDEHRTWIFVFGANWLIYRKGKFEEILSLLQIQADLW